jgi:hypothetical protein
MSMSEEPNISKDHLRQNTNLDTHDTENNLDDLGDKIKAGSKAMKKKIKDPDKDLQAEYTKEKFKEDTKDY